MNWFFNGEDKLRNKKGIHISSMHFKLTGLKCSCRFMLANDYVFETICVLEFHVYSVVGI